ncbi:MAG: alpha-1,2-fucosyltransferase [Clostridia bacterium]|nr:alpha-1,2-fucosyltransferase [Clostridia bacterium]
MITLFVSDGLGNQMFQYAFARSLQLYTGNNLQIALNCFEKDLASRKFRLSNLCIDDSIKVLPEEASRNKFLLIRIFHKIRTIMKLKNIEKYISKNYIHLYGENGYGFFDISKRKFSKNIVVMGQYQNPKYFEAYGDVIKKELKVKQPPSKQNAEKIKEILEDNSVCMHIRRGDYLDKKWSFLNICDENYYYEAMRTVSEKTEKPVFYVFSNSHEDIEWIKKNYNFSGYNVKFVDLDNCDYEELRLMYSCKHFIISNSTFSWWAQYLGEYDKKIVVAPSKWNNRKEVDDSGIFMKEWLLVDVENKDCKNL